MSNDHVHPTMGAILATFNARIDRRRILPPGECAYCDKHRNDGMMPPHAASARCESGKHNHCTCDACF